LKEKPNSRRSFSGRVPAASAYRIGLAGFIWSGPSSSLSASRRAVGVTVMTSLSVSLATFSSNASNEPGISDRSIPKS
jgi:hypothetical protein